MKNKDSKINDNKALKKELKKNIKELKKEKKKAIKKIKEEKEKTIEAIKKFAESYSFGKDDKIEVNSGSKNKGKSSEISKEELEKSFENLPTTLPTDSQSVDLKADEAIARLTTLKNDVDIDVFLKKEKRSTILKAAEKRKTEIGKSNNEI